MNSKVKMDKRQFRFKAELFAINGVFNIPALIICQGHGYGFETYCCKYCGEIFVVELGDPHNQNTDLTQLCVGKACPECANHLTTCLVKYPENIFFNGSIIKNTNKIDKTHFGETEIRDAFSLLP